MNELPNLDHLDELTRGDPPPAEPLPPSDTTGAGESLRYVFVTRPRCPQCGSSNLKTQKTRPKETDDSVTRETVCKDCQWWFLVVVE
jgi:hypothetical protein